MRHGRAWGPKALRRIAIQEKTKVGEYLVADTREALVALCAARGLPLVCDEVFGDYGFGSDERRVASLVKSSVDGPVTRMPPARSCTIWTA